MGTLDIILLCCFIPAVVTGILKGFIEQATNLVAIICSAWAAFKFATLLADWMAGFLTVDEKLLRIIAFIIPAPVTFFLQFLSPCRWHAFRHALCRRFTDDDRDLRICALAFLGDFFRGNICIDRHCR